MTDAHTNWLGSLRHQVSFYGSNRSHARSDREFDWAWYSNLNSQGAGGFARRAVRDTKSLVKDLLRTLPVRTRWSDQADAFSLRWLERHAPELWQARESLVDEMSRLLFDLHLVLRATGHSRFYFPRTEFVDLVDVVDDEPFRGQGLPHDYLGLPLHLFGLRLSDRVGRPPIKVVSTQLQVQLLNSYRQYLVKRGPADLAPKDGDVVLDCGACIGEVSLLLAALVGPRGAVHLFDPVPLHAQYCRLQGDLNPELRDVLHTNVLAVGETSRMARGTKQDAASISPGGLAIDSFDTTSIDDYVASKKLDRVDVIKMDIEGAELAALRGAAETLRRFRPKLAISAYHKPEDLWELPQKMKEIVPDYDLYFAHHSPIQWESVYYAIPRE